MGGVNFQLQSRSGDENCCYRSIAMQAISKSNMFDQTVSIFVDSMW